jgi:hypothetical protein
MIITDGSIITSATNTTTTNSFATAIAKKLLTQLIQQ